MRNSLFAPNDAANATWEIGPVKSMWCRSQSSTKTTAKKAIAKPLFWICPTAAKRSTEFAALPPIATNDEVSGQLITYNLFFLVLPLNWKSWLLGFILFRAFDIWKPFPARQLEHLPGGWGIMADDWMAGIYAAIVLRVALHFRVL
jgi:phosphatidylglycerophosphatase A